MKRLLGVVALVCATTTAALADPTSDVKTAMTNLGNASSYHLTATAAGHTIAGDYVKPGKMHAAFGPMEVIQVDGATYVKLRSTWHHFAIPGASRLEQPFSMAKGFSGSASSKIAVDDLGMKTVDGASLHAYLVKVASHPEKSSTVYVDSNAMPVRIEHTGSHGTEVVTLSNFNAPVSIVAPI